MVNGIWTINPGGLNKGFGSKFNVGSWVQHKTPKGGQMLHQPKRCEYNNSPNTLNDKNHYASFQKFWQIKTYLYILHEGE